MAVPVDSLAKPPPASSTLRFAFGNVLAFFILLLIGVLAFSIRLFSVIKYESVIHEFDPYFNYRVTQFLTKNGIYDFWNWFDDRTWYPLGRVIGGTVYPGLTLTAGTIWKVLQSLNIPLSVETVCVFTAPVFSAFAAWAAYLLTKEVKGTGAGLTAAVLLAMVPSYISRSVAGSYDNEAVAIFALIFTFYLYVKTLNTGSLFYATLNSIAYFYMVCSWGGYTFIINLIPMHVLLCIVTGRYSSRLYIAYAPLVVLGTLLAALVPVVGFNAVMTSEHFASFLVFIVIHVVALAYYIKGILSPKMFKVAATLVVSVGLVVGCAVVAVLVAVVASSPTKGWSGRSLSLLDPTYASKYIPIIASVSEHQPPTWPSYFMDLNVLAFLVPAGIIACFSPLSDASSFVILYLVMSVYFSGVMVRLMLVLAPAACIMSGIALSEAFDVFTRSIKFYITNLSESLQIDAGDAVPGNGVSPQNDVLKNDKKEDTLKERPSRKNKKKEKETIEKPSVKSTRGLRASIFETVNIISKAGEVTKILVTGEISVQYNFPTVRDHSHPVRIRINNFETLEKSAPNTSYLRPAPDLVGQYDIDTSLLSLAGGASVAVMKYQVHIDPENKNTYVPLQVIPHWKCESNLTSLAVSYHVNPECKLTGNLSELSFIVPVDGEVGTVQSKPTGVWSMEKQRIYWQVGDVDLSTSPERKRILARFETGKTSTPAPAAVRFLCKGQLLSNISIDIVPSVSNGQEQENSNNPGGFENGFKFQEITCQVSSGKFIASQ